MRSLRWIAAGGLIAAAAVAGVSFSRAADPSTLWHIVNDKCVPHQEQDHDPAPCAEVDLSQGRDKGFVILKDIRGDTQYLLMPTNRIIGIESPEILAPGVPNYWADAWTARSFVEGRLHHSVPREDISLAVNSIDGRTQNQLHIHIDCVAPEVKAAIRTHSDQIGKTWTPFPTPFAGHPYRAVRIDGAELGDVNPFKLLANTDPQAAANMGLHTLVLVGATFAGNVPGFVLFDDQANLAAGDRGSGEELQDHSCEVGTGS
jgi:CDP-diacylglycerol pyrophosphatase